ncbi:Os04g0495075, partial [Oryza sativa Japonica Group]
MVVGAVEHHARPVGDRREHELGALVPASAPRLVRHLQRRPRRVRVHGKGPDAPVAGVPDGERQRVPPPGHGRHLLHQRALPPGHHLHGVRAARHRVARRVHVLDDLRGRHDHPPGQRRVHVLVHRRHQDTPRRV